MIKHNYWISHNLDERLKDKRTAFKLMLYPQEFKVMDFHSAADYTAKEIAKKHEKIFLAFSGGADSEYVFRCLVRNEIQFIPVVVCTEINEWESTRALELCRQFNIVPVIIRCDRHALLKIYETQIVEKLNGLGFDVGANLLIACYVKQQKGVLLNGTHIISEHLKVKSVDAYDWDFYTDVLVENVEIISFMCYNIEIFYAMLNDSPTAPFEEGKYELYCIPPREKVGYYKRRYSDYFAKLSNIDSSRILPENCWVEGSAIEVLNRFKEFRHV